MDVHIPNPPKNKNSKSLSSNLLLKLIILAHETLQTDFATKDKNFFSNLEHYDLTNGKEFESEV